MSVYTRMKDAGIPIENHYSDLYVPATDQTREILEQSKAAGDYFCAPTTFTSTSDGKQWFDIPFMFDPYWFRKRG